MGKKKRTFIPLIAPFPPAPLFLGGLRKEEEAFGVVLESPALLLSLLGAPQSPSCFGGGKILRLPKPRSRLCSALPARVSLPPVKIGERMTFCTSLPPPPSPSSRSRKVQQPGKHTVNLLMGS